MLNCLIDEGGIYEKFVVLAVQNCQCRPNAETSRKYVGTFVETSQNVLGDPGNPSYSRSVRTATNCKGSRKRSWKNPKNTESSRKALLVDAEARLLLEQSVHGYTYIHLEVSSWYLILCIVNDMSRCAMQSQRKLTHRFPVVGVVQDLGAHSQSRCAEKRMMLAALASVLQLSLVESAFDEYRPHKSFSAIRRQHPVPLFSPFCLLSVLYTSVTFGYFLNLAVNLGSFLQTRNFQLL